MPPCHRGSCEALGTNQILARSLVESLVSGVLGARALQGARVGAGIATALVVMAPPAAVVLLRNARLVRAVGFAAAFLLVLPLGLAGSVPAGEWLVRRLSG